MSNPVVCAIMCCNESAIIERCLNSTLGKMVTRYIVQDTGSTDNTREIILNWGVVHNKKVAFFNEKWVDFSTNRNQLLQACLETQMDDEYVLITDADYVWAGEGVQKPFRDDPNSQPAAQGYDIKVQDGSPEYRLPLLIRNEPGWVYTGRTHECLNGPPRLQYDGLTALHLQDGADRKQKFERDLRLLQQDVDEDRTNARSTFYLANTYRDLGFTNIAWNIYEIRGKMLHGWDEETYYALYQAAKISNRFDDYMRAFMFRPSRSEALLSAVKYLNVQGKFEAAEALGLRNLNTSSTDVLWVDRWVETVALPAEVQYARQRKTHGT
jgi:glycosyltransferase involved in cell wall biosynthesis